jgi:hypothetical protein
MPIWLVLALAWLIIVAQLLAAHWSETAQTLSDMDDAMRLVQVREFLAGRGWFDLHEMRLGPPDGYDTHWSRLIDAGIAGLYLVLRPFTDTAFAERIVRTIWPMLWLLPAMAGAAAIAWRLAGRAAAPIALLLTAIGLPAFQHFIPGRIDHHNVQIALAVLLVAAAAWSDRIAWAAAAAGALTGAAMAIGFEGVPYVVLAGAALALRHVCDPAGTRALARYGTWAAASVAVAFAVSIGPAHWSTTACDAIAINSAAAVIVATLGLALSAMVLRKCSWFKSSWLKSSWLKSSWFRQSWLMRAAGVAVSGAAATAVFIVLEPQCLAGPFAMMDPTVRTIWFNHVSEMQSLWMLARTSPPMAAAVAAFPIVAMLCALTLARDPALRRDFGFLVTAAALSIACAVMIIMVRAYSYAIWLAIPMAAVGVLRAIAYLRLGTVVGRLLVGLLLTPTVTSAIALATVQAVTRQPVQGTDARVAQGCLLVENYAQLADLPPGLVATDIDYGPFILALTPHAVMSAPYHRLVAPIIAAHQIFALPPEAARDVVLRYRPAYLVTCSRHTLGGIGDTERSASLWGRLAAGDIPDWLEPIPRTRDQPFVVYRVRL